MDTKEVIVNGKKEIIEKMEKDEIETPFLLFDADEEDTIELTPEMIQEIHDEMGDSNG